MELLENARVMPLERDEIALAGVTAVHLGQSGARRAAMVEERVVEIEKDGARKTMRAASRGVASVYSAATVSEPPYPAGRVNASLASRGSRRGNSHNSLRRAT